jgi:hypothetical protein
VIYDWAKSNMYAKVRPLSTTSSCPFDLPGKGIPIGGLFDAGEPGSVPVVYLDRRHIVFRSMKPRLTR